MTYAQQLRDRRWQRKRLEILERDQWCCKHPECTKPEDDAVMLVVHHRVYHAGKMPWEYEDPDLLTLCERCHGKVHNLETKPPTQFELGEFYSWRELSSLLGFTPTPYLTNAKGTIVCGTFRKDMNPDAPTIVLPGTAKDHWAENAQKLCKQRASIPVFTKEAGLPWEYHGRFKGEGCTENPTEIEIHQHRAKERSEAISLVLFLQKVKE
jgi:hypothetical protein